MNARSDNSIHRCAALATAAALLLAGCGQTGPLRLPARSEVVVRLAAEPAPLRSILGTAPSARMVQPP